MKLSHSFWNHKHQSKKRKTSENAEEDRIYI